MKNLVVITSINEATDAVVKFSTIPNWKTLIVGDVKSKFIESTEDIEFLSIDVQKNLPFKSINSTPYNHYCRKNLGYLVAMQYNRPFIYETDDDTFPIDAWETRQFITDKCVAGEQFFNVYSLFTKEFIWPRGLHLPYIKSDNVYTISYDSYNVGVWQGLIDGDSDVDAIYRLTIDKHITFDKDKEFSVAPGTYVPFNTQSTLWNKKFYKLMYLPVSVNFRYTDILRSYVAQRVMWEHGYHVGFHSPNTYQIRNAHNYYHDFINEISMYETVPTVIQCLQEINLTTDIDSSLMAIYEKLVSLHIVDISELDNLTNWLYDINSLNIT